MDPLSITAAVVGITSATAKLAPTLWHLANTIKDAPKTTRDIMLAMGEINRVAEQLKGYIERRRTAAPREQLILVRDLEITLADCVLACSELEAILKSLGIEQTGGMRRWDRMKWAYKEADIQRIVQRLQNHKSSLSFMLVILQSDSDMDIRAHRIKLYDMVSRVLKSNRELSERLQGVEQSQEALTHALTRPAPALAYKDGPLDSSCVPLAISVAKKQKRAILSDLEANPNKIRTLRSTACLLEHTTTKSDWNGSMVSVTTAISMADVANFSSHKLPVYATDLSNSHWYAFKDTGGLTPDHGKRSRTPSGSVEEVITDTKPLSHVKSDTAPLSEVERAHKASATRLARAKSSLMRPEDPVSRGDPPRSRHGILRDKDANVQPVPKVKEEHRKSSQTPSSRLLQFEIPGGKIKVRIIPGKTHESRTGEKSKRHRESIPAITRPQSPIRVQMEKRALEGRSALFQPPARDSTEEKANHHRLRSSRSSRYQNEIYQDPKSNSQETRDLGVTEQVLPPRKETSHHKGSTDDLTEGVRPQQPLQARPASARPPSSASSKDSTLLESAEQTFKTILLPRLDQLESENRMLRKHHSRDEVKRTSQSAWMDTLSLQTPTSHRGHSTSTSSSWYDNKHVPEARRCSSMMFSRTGPMTPIQRDVPETTKFTTPPIAPLDRSFQEPQLHQLSSTSQDFTRVKAHFAGEQTLATPTKTLKHTMSSIVQTSQYASHNAEKPRAGTRDTILGVRNAVVRRNGDTDFDPRSWGSAPGLSLKWANIAHLNAITEDMEEGFDPPDGQDKQYTRVIPQQKERQPIGNIAKTGGGSAKAAGVHVVEADSHSGFGSRRWGREAMSAATLTDDLAWKGRGGRRYREGRDENIVLESQYDDASEGGVLLSWR